MGLLLSKVQIDGITIHDDTAGTPNLLINWEYERTGTNEISELTIKVLKSITGTVTLAVGKTVSIWKGFTTSTDTKVFEGRIAQFDPDGGLIKIIAKDKLWDLIKLNINKVYEDTGPQAGEVSAIAKDLIETYGLLTSDEQATGTAVGQTIAEFRCVHTDIFERLKALADAVRYQFWYDAVNDTVHFEPQGYNDSATTLTVGADIIGVPRWSDDTSRLVNDLRVDGAVVLTQIRKPVGTGNGVIDTTADFDTTDILLDKTPESVELILENANPPTEVKEGGTKDASSGNFYYVDKENKKVMPATGTTFTAGHRAIVNYNWFAPAPIHQINQASIDSYTKFEKEMVISDIQTIADAEVRTAEILARFSQPFKVGELLVKSVSTVDVNLGDSVIIVDNVSSPAINQSFVVTKQVIKYPGSNQELTVGDEGIRLADWQLNVENRLKRIEETLNLTNQDLILELIDIQLNLQQLPRYRKITTTSIAGDTLIWGSSDFGVWGTSKWGSGANTSFVLGHSIAGVLGTSKLGSQASSETNHWIQQYNNSYTEDFIDNDFEDSSGTATGWTSGSLDFTAGQIGQSTSIDYNNGTITAATLTATEVSGSFTYKMSADGGANYETVTSGVAHTFTNTGTDLCWRAVEDAASTGEISKIEVTAYH
jgi:hypothetical protein